MMDDAMLERGRVDQSALWVVDPKTPPGRGLKLLLPQLIAQGAELPSGVCQPDLHIGPMPLAAHGLPGGQRQVVVVGQRIKRDPGALDHSWRSTVRDYACSSAAKGSPPDAAGATGDIGAVVARHCCINSITCAPCRSSRDLPMPSISPKACKVTTRC